MKQGPEVSPFCVYTIVHSEKLKEILAQGGSGRLTERKPWTQASRLLDEAKSVGHKMPILFSAAENTSDLCYCAFLADIELGSDSTAYSFTWLSPISNPPPKTSLKLKQTGKSIHENFTKPYAICHAPAFTSQLLQRSSSSEEPRPTLNRDSTETARNICDTLLPDKTLQRFILGELFRSIRHLPPSQEKLRWGLTLARTHIRLNVGPLEAFVISESEVGILLYEAAISDTLRSQLQRFRTVHYKALPVLCSI